MSETNSTKPSFFKRLFIFFTTPKVFLNCFGMILASTLLLWLAFSGLKFMSNHGQTYEVPDFTDQHVDDVLKEAKKSRFEIVVNDTTFVNAKDLGIVLHQDPKPLSRAKEGRLIYLTVNSFAKPKREIPQLYGLNFNHAIRVLSTYEFEHEIIKRVIDSDAPGTVKEVIYNGNVVDGEDGFERKYAMARIGDKIELVVAEEFDAGPTQVPDLMCLTYSEALFKIRSGHDLMLGTITMDSSVRDSMSAYVVAQFPHYIPGQFIKTGDQIDLRLSQQKPKFCGSKIRGEHVEGQGGGEDMYPNHSADPDGRW